MKLSRRFKILIAFAAVLAATLVVIRIWPRESLAAQIPSSTAVFDRNGKLLRLTLADDQQYRLWTSLDDVSPEFLDALLLHEDHHFYTHPGVDPVAMLRATWATLTHSSHQGGSTISMQLARLFYHLNTRSITGKLVQMARAVQLELCYSKRQLLEAHVNLLPYGNNIQGVGTASLIYFGKPASRLSLPEALSLVLIPQSPARRDPDAQEPAALIEARLRLFKQWHQAHQVPDTMQSMSVPLRYASLKNLPFVAPQFVNHVLELTPDMPPAHRMFTSLDRNQQILLERILQRYVRDHGSMGIHNAAAMLVDVQDMTVRAMIGSADFYNGRIDGQVNGTLAKRSPGSALKPFIYALAIDQGLIHPLSMLKDVPTSFGAFSPENFDGRFTGPVSATQALIRSRNIPAVALNSRLSNPTLYQFLQSAGISQLQSEQHYGLALALGGGEVTMEELVTLYAMLADHGVLLPLRYTMNAKQAAGTPLISAAASFMVLDMLRQNIRPDDAIASEHSKVHVAWKTGTSWAFRDAWTAGVFGHYVLAVWVGNFDGSSNPAFVGIQAAAPLFFQMADALRSREIMQDLNAVPPRSVTRVEVCAASGDLPNAACPQTVSTWFVPGVSPIKVSDIHRRVMIDTRTGKMACPPYDTKHVRAEVFEYWPSDLAQSFALAGMPRRKPPVNHCSNTAGSDDEKAPHITSPLTSVVYTLRMHAQSQTIPLSCNLDADSHEVFWFADSSYIGKGKPGMAIPWTPPHAGHFDIRAVDDQGRAADRGIEIEYVQ
ncbi:MAG TPA: penicillin-binding protein 1C [Steroidobacteraceae bacterium]|nr:penicillin-binding protein 1C [Steroidobacteraceae bacterium]